MRGTTKVFGLGVALIIFSVAAAAVTAYAVDPGFAPGKTTRVSLNSAGEPAIGNGLRSGGLSADGHYVVFSSIATNLGASGQQVYRRECASRDCQTGTTEVVSVTPANAASSGFSPSVSANGRYVAFVSSSTDLVAGAEDRNGAADVFLRDMWLPRSTRLVSAIPNGTSVKAVGGTLLSTPDAHVVSYDDHGNVWVAFVSASPDLATDPNKLNTNTQIYVKNMTTDVLVLASERDGFAGNGPSSLPALSGDGRFVAFTSSSRNLTDDSPTTASTQIYVRDLAAGGTISLESKTWDNHVDTSGLMSMPALSGDGRYLAFESTVQLDNRDVRGDHDVSTWDVYLRDRTLQTTEVVSHSDTPTYFPQLHSQSPSISANGRFVAFHSIDMGLVTGDANGTRDVFLYDRTTTLLTLVSLNSDGVQANMPSSEPSVSGDGTLVLFASAATNLVTDPATTNLQLYLRDYATNVAPTVNLASTLDLVFTKTLDTTGSFTDPDLNETYSATVDYGDGAGTQPLALDGHSFTLHHTYAAVGTYTVTVTVSDGRSGGSTTATMVVTVRGYTYAWLDPIADMFVVGRNLPVKFTVRGPDGSFVLDQSVVVDVIDASGAVVAGPYVFGDQPSRSVTVSSDTYHVNVDTRDLAPGMYWLRVSFSSPTLTGEFTLGTTGTAATTLQGARVR